MAEEKIEDKGDGSLAIEIKLQREEFKEYWEAAEAAEASQVEIRGFRRGQAPAEMVNPYLNKEKIFNAAAEMAIKKTLKNIVSEKEWTLVAPPQVTIKEDNEGLTYEARVVPFPEVKLGEYKAAAKQANQELGEKLKNIKVTEEEVEQAIGWLRASREKKREGDKEKKTELTDEEAKSFGNFKSVAELKDSIREGLVAEKKVREADKNRARILEEAIRGARLTVPAMMTERAAENMKEELKQSLNEGNITFDEYVKKYYESGEKLSEALKQQAEKEIRAHLVLDAIAKEEKVIPTQEETQEEMNRHLAAVSESKKREVNLQQLYDFGYGKVKNEKVFRWLEKI